MGNLIKIVFKFIGSFVFFLTGELLLYLITFGRHRARKSIKESDESGNYAKGQIYFEASYYIGIVFWILMIVAINKFVL
jgi:hypothetical protein